MLNILIELILCGKNIDALKDLFQISLRIAIHFKLLNKTLESPLDCKEIQPVHPKGDQSWVLIGRTDAEAETPLLWPPHVKS